MRILVVTNLYPTAQRPFMSTFVKEQVESMREHCPDVTIDVDVIEGCRPKGAYLRKMLRLPAVVKKGRYDIVYAHFGLTLVSTLLYGFLWSSLFMARICRRIRPNTCPDFWHPGHRGIVVSQKLRDSLGYGDVIPCGIPVKKFTLPLCHENKPNPRIPGELKVLFPSDPANKVKDYGLFQAVRRELERRAVT